jgi:hypothetical protein
MTKHGTVSQIAQEMPKTIPSADQQKCLFGFWMHSGQVSSASETTNVTHYVQMPHKLHFTLHDKFQRRDRLYCNMIVQWPHTSHLCEERTDNNGWKLLLH